MRELSRGKPMTEPGSNKLPKSERAIQAVKPKQTRAAYTIRDAKGLRLVVHPKSPRYPEGNKVWFAVHQQGKGQARKRIWREIGPVSDISLSEALDRVGDAKPADPKA